MDKGRKTRISPIEMGKNLLIVLLSVSAIWMVSGGALQGWFASLQEELPRFVQTEESVQQAEAASPLRIIGTISGGETLLRRSVQHDAAAVDKAFQQTAGLLMEALSSTQTPENIGRNAWERALGQAPGLCFDFLGEIPLSVLSGWLGVERGVPDVNVRRLVLTVWEDSTALYYQDLTDDCYYRCLTPVVSAAQLEMALEDLGGEDAYYAFESGYGAVMAADTLLAAQPGTLLCYGTSNPVSGGRSALSQLMEEMEFNLSACVFYPAAGEEVARSGSQTIRLSQDGELDYSGSEGHEPFELLDVSGESEVFCAVESCRRLAAMLTGGRSGQARLFLTEVKPAGEGWKVCFDYCVNGVPVELERGHAAEFETNGERITAFTLWLRTYSETEQRQPLLPPVQAAAAMDALNLRGRELAVVYADHGEELLIPTWAAIS